jgi:GNAT superfamily N-acetyltransferase
VEPVTDPDRIARVLTHPAILPHISDDLTPTDWAPALDESRVYLMPADDSACFVFSHHSGALCEGHLSVMPDARDRSDALGKEALAWMRDNTAYACVIGFVNAGNRPARQYVERLGFEAKARLPRAAIKGGQHMDVIFYTRNL